MIQVSEDSVTTGWSSLSRDMRTQPIESHDRRTGQFVGKDAVAQTEQLKAEETVS